jgi:hypothetical protein
MSPYRSGLLIIRTWFERGSSKPLRAHIRSTTDVSNGFEQEVTSRDAASASEVVKTWLDEAEAAGGSTDDPAKEFTETPSSD